MPLLTCSFAARGAHWHRGQRRDPPSDSDPGMTRRPGRMAGSLVLSRKPNRRRARAASGSRADSEPPRDSRARIRRVRAERAGPERLTTSGAVARRYVRSAWTHGQYGGAPASSQTRPHRTRWPRSRAIDASSSANRLLPIPGSPPSRTRRPRPDAASASASRSSSSSRSRPTNGPLVRGWCTAGRLPLPSHRSISSEREAFDRRMGQNVWVSV